MDALLSPQILKQLILVCDFMFSHAHYINRIESNTLSHFLAMHRTSNMEYKKIDNVSTQLIIFLLK